MASRKLISSTWHRDGQLLQYSHAYQLSVCANVKMMDARVCVLPRTTERCENKTNRDSMCTQTPQVFDDLYPRAYVSVVNFVLIL